VRSSILLFAFPLIAFALPASAATVESIQGKVSINRGAGFQQIGTVTQANPGDLVMASPDSSAEIVYRFAATGSLKDTEECRVKVAPGAVVSVTDETACRRGTGMYGGPLLLGALAVGGGIAIITTIDKDPASP
jgi:hypothetical protein